MVMRKNTSVLQYLEGFLVTCGDYNKFFLNWIYVFKIKL